MEKKGTAEDCSLIELGIGLSCKKGLKPESPNQDDFFIVKIDDWALYGVFDGHGPFGHDISNYVQRELPKLIYNNEHFWNNPKAALRFSFNQVHRDLEKTAASTNRFNCSLSGTTATVILSRNNKLYIAHVGDSRAVIASLCNTSKRLEAIDLTNDHKPNLEIEKRRILQCGGQVRRLEGDIPYRVFLKGRLYPGLAMSRAIGDTLGTSAGVIPDPDVSEYDLDESRDIFLIICSDGVWEFISSQEAVDMVAQGGIEGVQESSELLARESWQRWINEEQNVVDDITAQVIYLFPDK